MLPIITLCILGFFILAFLVIYNRLVTLRNKVKQSKSSIDVYLNQRFDLIPNLAECAKAYAEHEKSTFEAVARGIKEYNMSRNKDIKVAEKLYKDTAILFARAEAYPELKASELFLNLQKELTRVENNLQAARRLYNGDVTLYNTTIEIFPNNILSKFFNFNKEEFFKVENEEIKQNIKVSF